VSISIPESLVVALPPILSPSSRTFVELTLVNWRRPWGSRRLDFVIRAGSFNLFINKINKFYGCRQQQQPNRVNRSIRFGSTSSTRSDKLLAILAMISNTRLVSLKCQKKKNKRKKRSAQGLPRSKDFYGHLHAAAVILTKDAKSHASARIVCLDFT
jgi:hypothetical protein